MHWAPSRKAGSEMKIFIDTADLPEIREACSWGIVDGLTTNPSLIRRAVEGQDGVNIEAHLEEICRIVPGPVSLEVASLNTEQMVAEAVGLYDRFNRISGNVVVKIPVNTSTKDGDPDFEGLKAIVELAQRKIPVNATLIMTPEQALLCAKAGAAYVSPFMGRVDDFTSDTHSAKGLLASSVLVAETVHIFRAYRFDCEVIAASVRHVSHVREAESAGADIATIPFPVILQMARHPKTSEGIQRFTADLVPAYSELLSVLSTR